MKLSERYSVQALAASVSTFSHLSFEGWCERVRQYHLAWGLSDEGLRLGYALWLERRREEKRDQETQPC